VRKIVVYELLSLDGVAEAPDSFFADWDAAMDANLAAVIATQDAVILGRRSYTEWAQFLTACHRFSSNRSEARSHRLAICSSTIALFVKGVAFYRIYPR